MVVPPGAPISSLDISLPPCIWYLRPVTSSAVLVIISTWATAAILASASPRKPREEILRRSSTVTSLLVACLSNASLTSSFFIPAPLSVTLRNDSPPPFTSTVTAVAPESMEFSTSSLMTELGFSITSPAAILLIVFWSNTFIITYRSLLFKSLLQFI